MRLRESSGGSVERPDGIEGICTRTARDTLRYAAKRGRLLRVSGGLPCFVKAFSPLTLSRPRTSRGRIEGRLRLCAKLH